MTDDQDRAIALAITGLKELMEANFRTVHVHLEQLAKMRPDVEELKADVAELRLQGAARQQAIEQLRESLDHMAEDYMRRDELFQTFMTRKETGRQKDWTRSTMTLIVGGTGVVASIIIGVLNLVS